MVYKPRHDLSGVCTPPTPKSFDSEEDDGDDEGGEGRGDDGDTDDEEGSVEQQLEQSFGGKVSALVL